MMHAHRTLLTDVLKGELSFTGFLVSDWQAIDQLSADYYDCVTLSINAGLDMVMVPYKFQRFIHTLEKAVLTGDVPSQRIDDAVGRILTVKFELGLFDRKREDEPMPQILGCAEHRQLAREAVRKSLVVLKNDNSTLPITGDSKAIVVAGASADSVGLQCGGWTIEWLGGEGNNTTGTTLLQALRQAAPAGTTVHFDKSGHFLNEPEADVGIVCLHETPYAEGVGDRADLHLNEEQINLLNRVRARCLRLVAILFSGRPLIITEQFSLTDAWIAAWLPGTEGQGITDVLFGDYPPVGKLPFTWPRTMSQIPLNGTGQAALANEGPLFPVGYGLSIP